MAALLHHCEAQSVDALGVKDFWVPTPFPIERE